MEGGETPRIEATTQSATTLDNAPSANIVTRSIPVDDGKVARRATRVTHPPLQTTIRIAERGGNALHRRRGRE